jgi:hypothetical protein
MTKNMIHGKHTSCRSFELCKISGKTFCFTDEGGSSRGALWWLGCDACTLLKPELSLSYHHEEQEEARQNCTCRTNVNEADPELDVALSGIGAGAMSEDSQDRNGVDERRLSQAKKERRLLALRHPADVEQDV